MTKKIVVDSCATCPFGFEQFRSLELEYVCSFGATKGLTITTAVKNNEIPVICCLPDNEVLQ